MHDDTIAEILSACQSMGEAVNKAAKHLPPGWIISIEIEKDGYDVVLRDPAGNRESMDGDGILSEVNEAICWANGFYG